MALYEIDAFTVTNRQDDELVTKKEIKSALLNDGCITLFLPKVELAAQSNVGFEALSRLKLESGRVLYLDTFLTFIKQYDLSNLFNQVLVKTSMREIQNSAKCHTILKSAL